MKKLGFTLIELLVVIIILAVIALIATPIILNVINDSKKSTESSSIAYYASAVELTYAENMVNENKVDLRVGADNKVTNGKVFCETIGYLESRGVILDKCTVNSPVVYSMITKVKAENLYYFLDKIVLTERPKDMDKIIASLDNKIDNDYTDLSGASKPEVDNGLIPIFYDEEALNWKVADTTKEWYNYEQKKWANAVVLKEGITKKVGEVVNEFNDITSMFVWIPKYKYAVPAGGSNGNEKQINVIFENSKTKKSTGSAIDTDYFTHPAFTFGTTELNGIWVGKFETSSKITVPNSNSGAGRTVSQLFTIMKNFGIDSGYQLDIEKIESRMIKNFDWGAVAYLKQSKYGLGTTDIAINETLKTGAGDYKKYINQSTTGNITGIYDMSGGHGDLTMSNFSSNGKLITGTNQHFNSGFNGLYGDLSGEKTDGINPPDKKYYDSYTTNIGYKGDSTNADAIKDWYGDILSFVDNNHPWFERGGLFNGERYAGIFSASGHDGGAASTVFTSRIVLTKP